MPTPYSAVPTLLLVLAVGACAPGEDAADAEAEMPTAGAESAEVDTTEAGVAAPGVVRAVITDFTFHIPDSVRSGWTTFRVKNAGDDEHFMYLYRLPEGMTYDRFVEEAMTPFGDAWMKYESGELGRDEALELMGETMPEWFFTELVPSGGPALIEPSEEVVTTVMLEPGTYVVECYVKSSDGTWHTMQGMQTTLVATEESNGVEPPEADVQVTLTNYDISVEGDLTPGRHTIAVRVEDTPEGFMTHDLNLFRLAEGESVDDVVAWMDWMDLEQFRAPAPGYSLGGVESQAAGRTGYFTVDLEPGRYAFVSEEYGPRGMIHEFTVE